MQSGMPVLRTVSYNSFKSVGSMLPACVLRRGHESMRCLFLLIGCIIVAPVLFYPKFVCLSLLPWEDCDRVECLLSSYEKHGCSAQCL